MSETGHPSWRRGQTVKDKIETIKIELIAATQDINNATTVATLRTAILRYVQANNQALKLIEDLLEMRT
jgi:hypothetical protein